MVLYLTVIALHWNGSQLDWTEWEFIETNDVLLKVMFVWVTTSR